MTQATGIFTMKTWDEKSYTEIEGQPKIAHAHTTNTYAGGISGEASANYVIFYPEERIGIFRGYEQIVGSIGDREGSFVLEHTGSWEGTTVTTHTTVVPDSGTGDMVGMTGSGGFVARHDIPETQVTLDFELPG
jgi:hypothetical protein